MQQVQPFSVEGNQIWFLNGTCNLLCNLWLHEDGFELKTYALGCRALLLLRRPSDLGIAYSSLNQHFLFTSWLGSPRPVLGFGPPSDLRTTALDWPFQDLTAVSAAAQGSEFVLICSGGSLCSIRAMVRFDANFHGYQRQEVGNALGNQSESLEGWILPQAIGLSEGIVLFSLATRLALCWVLNQEYYPVKLEIGEHSRLGPLGSDHLILLEHSGECASIARIGRSGRMGEIACWKRVPWELPHGVAMSSNRGLVVMDTSEALFVKVAKSDTFVRIPPDMKLDGVHPLEGRYLKLSAQEGADLSVGRSPQ